MRKRLSAFFARHPAATYAGLIALFVGIELLFSFCSKKSCPAFSDDNFDTWFPYTKGQRLFFRSSMNHSDTITIWEIVRSEGYETGGFESRASCDMNASIDAQLSNNFLSKLSVDFWKADTNTRLSLSVYDFRLPYAHLQTQSMTITAPGYSSQYSPSAVLGGVTFAGVVEIQRDTTNSKQQGIYKIWLSRQNGLVAYEHYPTREQWVKQ